MKKGHITLVGAGPGDPDLISVKGLKALAQAQVVLYDALIHDDILSFAPSTAELVFVGKRKGVCQTPQESINELLVKYALSGQDVVRLKGGDPFIFGRGHEELDYVHQYGIETSVIPGISSVYSVPELVGIPLTRRGISESFWVVTATTKEHRLSQDIALAAQSTATVVILMGMHKLYEIIGIYRALGKENEQIAIIQNGSKPEQKIGYGRLDSIEEIVKEKQLSSPAIIVIGDVVQYINESQTTTLQHQAPSK